MGRPGGKFAADSTRRGTCIESLEEALLVNKHEIEGKGGSILECLRNLVSRLSFVGVGVRKDEILSFISRLFRLRIALFIKFRCECVLRDSVGKKSLVPISVMGMNSKPFIVFQHFGHTTQSFGIQDYLCHFSVVQLVSALAPRLYYL